MVENHVHWKDVYNGSFSWKKNAEDIPIDSRYVTAGNTLIIDNLVINDEGNISMAGFNMIDKMFTSLSLLFNIYIYKSVGTYTCIASSDLSGVDTASAVLLVKGKPPQITPISSNLCFGSHQLETTLTKKAHINCVASGRPLPNMTWYMMSQV